MIWRVGGMVEEGRGRGRDMVIEYDEGLPKTLEFWMAQVPVHLLSLPMQR